MHMAGLPITQLVNAIGTQNPPPPPFSRTPTAASPPKGKVAPCCAFSERQAQKGKEKKGKERKGKGREGKGREGKERKGKERKGKERKGKERKDYAFRRQFNEKSRTEKTTPFNDTLMISQVLYQAVQAKASSPVCGVAVHHTAGECLWHSTPPLPPPPPPLSYSPKSKVAPC